MKHYQVTGIDYKNILITSGAQQGLAYHYMKDCDFDGHLKTVIDVYRRRRDVMTQCVRESFPEGTRVVLPNGGLFMWLELPEGVDTLEMFDYVFQKNIAYVPGGFFSPDGSGKNTMRLNFSTSSEEQIRRGIPSSARWCASIWPPISKSLPLAPPCGRCCAGELFSAHL